MDAVAVAVIAGLFVVGAEAFRALIARHTRKTQARADRRTAARAWRDDFYVAQTALLDAVAKGGWPDYELPLTPPLGDLDKFLQLASELAGRSEWTTLTLGRRIVLQLNSTASRGQYQETWAKDSFCQLERARKVVASFEGHNVWPWEPHPKAPAGFCP